MSKRKRSGTRRGIQNPYGLESLTKRFFTSAETAESWFVITPKAIRLDTGYGRRFRDIMFQKLGFYASETPPESEARYTFNLPNREEAERFWENMLWEFEATSEERIIGSPEEQKAHNALKRANESGALKVQTIPTTMCTLPLVVFNIERYDPSTSAYSFFIHYDTIQETNHLSLVEMDYKSLSNWRNWVYFTLRFDRVEVIDIPYNPNI